MQRTVVAVSQPAAGQGVSYGLPESEISQLVAVSFRLVASAVVANRRPVVSVTDGTGVMLAGVASATLTTAGATTDYSFAVGVAAASGASGSTVSESLPALPLGAGDTIVVAVSGIDAGDQLSRIRVTLLQDPVRPD